MQHVRFGPTGLHVSRLCLGTMTFGLQCDEKASFAILDAVAEYGLDPKLKQTLDQVSLDYRMGDAVR